METVPLGTKHMHFYFYLIQACMCNLQTVTLSICTVCDCGKTLKSLKNGQFLLKSFVCWHNIDTQGLTPCTGSTMLAQRMLDLVCRCMARRS